MFLNNDFYVLISISGLSGGFLINRFGRKGTIMFNTVFFTLCYLCLVAAQNVWMLFVGRFLCGLATGEKISFDYCNKIISANNSKIII